MSDQTLERLRMRAQLALDGELDAAHQLDFEAEMARSPELAAEYEKLRALRVTLRANAPREAAPEALRARIAALVEPEPVVLTPAPRAKKASPFWGQATAMAATLAVACSFAGYYAGQRNTTDPTLTALVAGYQRASLSGQQVDVASSDRHTVKPWLASRAPLGSLAPDLASDGYPLIGGRIDIVDRRPVPTLVYRHHEHMISVSELPLAQISGGDATLDGYHVERWKDGERGYVAISDMDMDELGDFISLFRKHAAP